MKSTVEMKLSRAGGIEVEFNRGGKPQVWFCSSGRGLFPGHLLERETLLNKTAIELLVATLQQCLDTWGDEE